jgi:hypothetical protein
MAKSRHIHRTGLVSSNTELQKSGCTQEVDDEGVMRAVRLNKENMGKQTAV